MLSEREKDAALWSAQGVYEALTTSDHLGVAAQRVGAVARTKKGDIFEHSFEWAREKASGNDTIRPVDESFKTCETCNQRTFHQQNRDKEWFCLMCKHVGGGYLG